MRNLYLIICCLIVFCADAQDDKQTVMEKRARELHRVMGLSDKEQWKEFMIENYTKDMLERPVKSNTVAGGKEKTSITTATATSLKEKLKMFERLHHDFGKSKIVSLKAAVDQIDMQLENASGLKGNFTIIYETGKPYLIDKVRVEVNQP